jgi:REP element-mobilizing transposase RayT
MSSPRAYLLTWTTYGTWLPGDERGSVDAEHNAPGGECAAPDAKRHAANVAAMAQPALLLDAPSRRIVHATILAHCAFRGWEIVALNVRSNHVHVVLRCGEISPKRAAQELKAWATRRLRAAGQVAPGRHVWTERGSGRYLWDEGSVKDAETYVTDCQGTDLE